MAVPTESGTAHPAVLTIAGSDSGGGAGVQADLKTFQAHSTYGTSVITALTAQNTQHVAAVHTIPPQMVTAQINAVMDDIDIKAAKTGMLSSRDIISAVATAWKQQDAALVVDPVMIATSGARLLSADAVAALCNELLPLATIVTPNLREAEVILGLSDGELATLKDMEAAARRISTELGPEFTVIKGGHSTISEATVTDVIYCRSTSETVHITNPRIKSESTHGTGCTLSAAITANIAHGLDPVTSIRRAITYVNEAIQAAYPVGCGHGPVDHAYQLITRAIPKPMPLLPHPFTQYLKDNSGGVWDRYINHKFVRCAGDGSLARTAFIFYLKQDYLYLKHYARSNALAAFKSSSMGRIAEMADVALGCARESSLHIRLCEEWGISKDEMERVDESWSSVAYTRYIIDVGMSGDVLDLLVAMYPCLLGYGEAATRQAADPQSVREGNPYWPWIENYAGCEFMKAVEKGRALIEDIVCAEEVSKTRLERLLKIFVDTATLEIKFWDHALKHN